jgi:hypothetical protein
MYFACGASSALAGCAAVNATTAGDGMWGACREVALQRQSDERFAGYDPETLKAALSWTYKDCVSGDRRYYAQSSYGKPPPAPPAKPVTAAPAYSAATLLRPQD